MDKITATRVFEEELRAKEYKRIENTIEGYKIFYKPDIHYLEGTIFTFNQYDFHNFYCNRYHVVTYETYDRIYYRRLYAQIYHPSWEFKQLSKTCYKKDFTTTKYVFKYNENLMNEYAKNSMTIDEFYNNTSCFKSCEIYEIISDNHLDEMEIDENENNIEL
jgi:hypothetical protein